MPTIPYSIVIPAWNEEETIGDVILGVRHLTDDLIVVDGHSTDRTHEISRQLRARVVLDHGLGKGDAIRVGLATAYHRIAVFIDADGSHEPKDIPALVAPIAAGEADLVIASRTRGGSDELYGSFSELIRLVGSVLTTLAINYRYGVRLTDYQNGFRAISTEVGNAIGIRANKTTVEQEMAMLCLNRGYRVTEVPSHEYRRKAGESKIFVPRLAHRYVLNLLRGTLCRNTKVRKHQLAEAPLAQPSAAAASATAGR
ncbi:MAG: glycosyltransferase family 2 protein [Candidatus Solibacter sp.]|jgi:dolichol-phosphate mannosyltransferase